MATSSTPPGSFDATRPGFPTAILRAELEGKYMCSECKGLLRRPFQAQCGHRFCSYCLKKLVSSGPRPCAACLQEGLYEEGVSVLDSGSAFPDNAARREVESLPAACPRQDCLWEGSIKEYEAHDEACPKSPLTCGACRKTDIPRETFAEHIKHCGKRRAPCPFQPIGCPEVVAPEDSPLHETQRLAHHLSLLLAFTLRAAGETQPPGAGNRTTGPLPPAPGEETGGSSGAVSRAPQDQKVATLERIVCVLNREVERRQEEQEVLAQKIRLLERRLAAKEAALAEAWLALQAASSTTYDGVLVWKVEEVQRRREEALDGRAPAIFSPAFYTSRYGYKMCLRLYLNGDGSGRGTHLSLFFVLMKGPNDALLKWPFNQKVTLMLLDQDNREHMIDAFRPDIASSSFQRPAGDMNVASGCPLFCPLAKLDGGAGQAYVRDDTLFIKAIVDLAGL